jgi:hypothetical protein
LLLVRDGVLARLSNCGKLLRAFATASTWKHSSVHQGNDLGYGKNAKDWTIRSQVLKVLKSLWMLFNDYMAVGHSKEWLKIESGPPERVLQDERLNQPRA